MSQLRSRPSSKHRSGRSLTSSIGSRPRTRSAPQVRVRRRGSPSGTPDLGRRHRHQPARRGARRRDAPGGGALGARRLRRCSSWDGRPIVGPQDAIIVITHTAETAYAMAARALAFNAGMHVDHDHPRRVRRSPTRSRPSRRRPPRPTRSATRRRCSCSRCWRGSMGAERFSTRRSRSCPEPSATRSRRRAIDDDPARPSGSS